ncbi:hypothetical protein ACFLYA_00430 [Candidatus Dependentiae bacterium]
MRHIRISYFIPIFLLLTCFSAFSMDKFSIEHSRKDFTFDRKNYCLCKEIKNRRFFGVLKSDDKKIDVVNLPAGTLLFSIECDDNVLNQNPCSLGRYLAIGAGCCIDVVWDIDKKECLFPIKGVCERFLFGSGKLICGCHTKEKKHSRYGQDILIYDLKTKKLIAEYENCSDDVDSPDISTKGVMLDNLCRYVLFCQRNIPEKKIKCAQVLFDLENGEEFTRKEYENLEKCKVISLWKKKIWKKGGKTLLSEMKLDYRMEKNKIKNFKTFFVIHDLEKPFQEKLRESVDKKDHYQDVMICCKYSDKKERDLDQD